MAGGTYCTYSEVKDRFERIADYLDVSGTDAGTGHINRVIGQVCKRMDARLSLKYSVPVGTMDDGSYDEILSDTSSNGVIFQLLERRHSGDSEELPAWIQKYGSRYEANMTGLIEGKLALRTETTRQELGIQLPLIGTGNSGKARFYVNNGPKGYGDAYQGDYEKNYRFQIDGTTGTNAIDQCTFKYSEDDGITWLDTGEECGTTWIYVRDGIYVRWEGTSLDALGTYKQLEYGDWWLVKCIPMSARVEAGDTVISPDQLERNG